ncbi:MAG: RecX family transcriptional regulator [Flavobacteriales bacterium]|nr:RecX family transcriptional regulator [Flavobacteriales bacterium]MCB0793276.1 RecX family transcriptional regulator [Flavobacteriales bacterium]
MSQQDLDRNLERAKRYCARQERAHQEVRDKLYQWGLHRGDVEGLLSRLISDGFLNESRFAEHYAVSKLRQKGWGRMKIEHMLRAKKVSLPCIRLALDAIDQNEYWEVLDQQLRRSWERTHARTGVRREGLVKRYLMSRGFEDEAIEEALTRLKETGEP